MQKKEIVSLCTFYAISPIHAGSGAATSVVDLPIQRERHTNWPHVQASAVKGALRAHYRMFAGDDHLNEINLIFGSDYDNDGDKKVIKDDKGNKMDIPGAISVSDAKLLAFPVRSNIAPFVWVTSPAVLKRYAMDMEFLGKSINLNLPSFTNDDDAFIMNGSISDTNIIMEDAVVKIVDSTDNLLKDYPQLERLILISDIMYDFLVSSCTEVQTQIKIKATTGTTEDRSLRYQELLPADSFLYSIIYFSQASMNELQAKTIRSHIQDSIKDFIQIGGDETLGRGICKVNWQEGD